MEVNSASGSRNPLEAVKPAPPARRTEEPVNETRALANEEVKKANAEQPPKPVVNLQGQTIGGNINTTA